MSQFVKRAFDISVTLLAIVFLAIPLACLAIAIRLSMGSPVLFRQVRAGWRGKPFMLYKFRTMRDARGSDGKPLSDAERLASDAQRLTRFGRLLRSSSLDEFPQLWNVLRGEMSLVGPRPLFPWYTERYNTEQARRLEAKPGITGWAQVKGRNAISWDEKFALDTWYVDHQSFWLDLRILLLTVLKVLQRHGISQVGHETVLEWKPKAHIPSDAQGADTDTGGLAASTSRDLSVPKVPPSDSASPERTSESPA